MNVNIFDHIEHNAINNNYLDNVAITQINSQKIFKTISYKKLFELSTKVSLALLELGLKNKEKIYISSNDSINFISTFLGAMKIGIIPIPGNPELSNEQSLHILNDSTPSIVITDKKINKMNLNFAYRYYDNKKWKKLLSITKFKKINTYKSKINDTAFLIYSSGTTGLPKAIIHQHQIIINTIFLHKNILKLKEKDKIYTTSKLFFAYALGNNFFAPLLIGLNTIFNDNYIDSPNLSNIIQQHKPKAVFSVPTVYRRLLKDPDTDIKELLKIKYFISAGERIPNKLYKEWKSIVQSPLLNCYGTTETLAIVIATRPRNSKIGSTGKPIQNIETKLIDQRGKESKTKGILFIKHASFSKSYLNNKEKSLKTFNDGWLKTGDIWSLKNNYWYYQGREDDLIKVASKWVNPKELETEASKVENVIDSFCVAAESKQGTIRLALFLCIQENENEKLIIKKVKNKIEFLPKYKQPYWIKTIHEVPQTTTGKIKRNDLKKLIESEI